MPARANCNPGLILEEFDARSFADDWLAELRPALIEVAERGTYLDAADAQSFLDLSLPGVDEVMAALRILQLTDGSAQRIVVDTAPTGHLLRLLEAGSLLNSWSEALEAMARKADAVAIGMIGRAPEWAAVRLIEQWWAQSRAFADTTRNAQFVVVTRGDPVVEAETARLVEALHARHLPVAAIIANTQPSGVADWFAPRLETAPAGCTGLRTWIQATRSNDGPQVEATSSRASAIADHATDANTFDLLEALTEPLILVAGKGGVGKSTVASAIAVMKAADRAICLVSTDPAGSLSDVFGQPVSAEPAQLVPGLTVWQLAADAEFQRLRTRYTDEARLVFEKLGLDQAVSLDRAVIDRLWNLAPPGLDEIIAVTEVMAATERCPSVILDSAPTGHFLRLIQIPEVSIEWSHALMRLLLKYGVAGSLQDFTTELLAFARRTRELQERLTTPGQAAVVLVTLDEPVVWAETLRLHAALERAKIPVAALVINRADGGPSRGYPPVVSSVRVIRAPNLDIPPIGADALRSYSRRWED